MKLTIFGILGVLIVAAGLGYIRKGNASRAESAAQAAAALAAESAPHPENAKVSVAESKPNSAVDQVSTGNSSGPGAKRNVAASVSAIPAQEAAPAGTNAVDAATISRAIDTVLANESTHEQKQRAWRQLIQAGRLDDAIAALEQRRAAEPQVADYAASLGNAYIKKCSVIHDARDQGLLAMSADKLFDAALSLDQSNWEARFTKAVAMSFWPASMNKGEEVIGHFQTLIQQQEVKPAQPEFAETYLWLGDQYQKMGQGENAVAIWGRGASLFPTHDGLRNRLAAGTAGQ